MCRVHLHTVEKLCRKTAACCWTVSSSWTLLLRSLGSAVLEDLSTYPDRQWFMGISE